MGMDRHITFEMPVRLSNSFGHVIYISTTQKSSVRHSGLLRMYKTSYLPLELRKVHQ